MNNNYIETTYQDIDLGKYKELLGETTTSSLPKCCENCPNKGKGPCWCALPSMTKTSY